MSFEAENGLAVLSYFLPPAAYIIFRHTTDIPLRRHPIAITRVQSTQAKREQKKTALRTIFLTPLFAEFPLHDLPLCASLPLRSIYSVTHYQLTALPTPRHAFSNHYLVH